MVVSASEIETWYERVYARHATPAEQQQWSELGNTIDRDTLAHLVVDTAEADIYVDPVLRLYAGAFHRTPDTGDPNGDVNSGAQSGYWTNVSALRSGVSLQGLAEAFVASSEWLSDHGTRSLEEPIVIDLYQTILQRNPNADEVAAWMHSGLDMAHVLLGITESTEAKDLAYWKVTEYEKVLATTAFNAEHSSLSHFQGFPPPPGFFDPAPRLGGAYDPAIQHTIGIADTPQAHTI